MRIVRSAIVAPVFLACFSLWTISGHLKQGLQVQTNTTNRTLVVLLGSLRCEPCWSTLKRNLLDFNNADLALAIGRSSNHSANLYTRATYVWEFKEFVDWADALDQIGPHWRPFAVENLFGGASNLKGSGAILLYARWFLLRELRSSGAFDKYEFFVVTRADHYFICPHDLSPLTANANASSFIFVPPGEGYGGVTDRHLVVARKNLHASLSLLDEDGSLTSLGGEVGRFGNLEELIKARLKQRNLTVKYIPRTFFTSATPADSTRWRVAKRKRNEFGLHTKYHPAYVLAKRTCHHLST